MNTNIKYLVESFIDDEDEIEIEDHLSDFGENRDKRVKLNILDYLIGGYNIDLQERRQKEGLYNYGKLLNYFKNVTVDDLYNPEYTLVIELFSYQNPEKVKMMTNDKSLIEKAEFSLIFINFILDIKCKVKFTSFEYLPLHLNELSLNTNVSISFLTVFFCVIRDGNHLNSLLLLDLTRTEIIFLRCVLFSFKGFNKNISRLGLDIVSCTMPEDWEGFPNIMRFLEIEHPIKSSDDEDNKDLIKGTLKSLKNFPCDIKFTGEMLAPIITSTYSKGLAAWYKDYIKSLVVELKGTITKEEAKRLYKIFTRNKPIATHNI